MLYNTSMRTVVDVPEAQVELLDKIALAKERSRASLIREALADFLAKRRQASPDDGFGLWSNVNGSASDGLEYQERLRRDW